MKEIKLELPIVDLSGVCESMNELKKAVEEYCKREVVVRLGTALIKSGVKCSAIIEGSDEEVTLDFSEHDKMVSEEKDRKIAELEKIIDEKSGGWGKYGLTLSEIIELQDRHQSDCIRINQLLTTIDVLTERYQKLREVQGL